MASRAARQAQLEALRRSRAGELNRSKEFNSSSSKAKKIYDEVTDEDYKLIVRERLDGDDFIEDDDGSGYVDNGMDDFGAEDSDEGEDSDDSDADRRRKSKKKKATKDVKDTAKENADPTKQKMKKKPLPPPRPAAANPYKKAISADKEDDVMADIFGDLAAAAVAPRSPSPPAKKRKAGTAGPISAASSTASGFRGGYRSSASSSIIPTSSDPILGDASSSFVDTGPSSDGPDLFASTSSRSVKKHRINGAESHLGGLTLDADHSFDGGDDYSGAVVKGETSEAEKDEHAEDEDSITLKVVRKSKAAGASKRQLVNMSSYRAPKPKTELENMEEDLKLDIKPVKTLQDSKKPKGMDWQVAAEAVLLDDGAEDIVDEKDQVQGAKGPRKFKAPSAGGGSLKTAKVQALEEDGSVRFYWLDYTEVNGVLHFIGKVFDKETKKHVSASVTVEGIDRNLFVLPRQGGVDDYGNEIEPPTEDEVYEEFGQVAAKHGIKEWMGKQVERKYAFELPNVPQESSYLKVLYSYDQPQLPLDISGKTFSRVFGTNTSAFELFVLKRKIMGPCWLNLEAPEYSEKAISWCKLEILVTDPKTINPFSDSDETAPKEMPPMTVMSLSARSIVNHQANKKEIVSTSARVWQDMNIDDPTPIEKQPCSVHTAVRALFDYPAKFEDLARSQRSKIMLCQSERHLLNHLLTIVQRFDPDVIVGHEFSTVMLDVILHRLRDLKADHYSRIGRFRRMNWPKLKAGMNTGLLSGRLICDLASDGSKSMIQSTTWSLTEMCQTHLKIDREDIDPDDTPDYFDSYAPPAKLLHFVRHCEADSYFQMALAFKVQLLPLTKQLCNLAGNSWNKTLNGGRAERNEYILLHEFHRRKYICPDKITRWQRTQMNKANADPDEQEVVEVSKKSAKRDKYKGGLVFEPKRGLWDKYVLVMDFNSLYPSIIQEFNIDFTTVERNNAEQEEAEEDIDKMPDVPDSSAEQGVLPRLIATLVNRRKQVKSLMKDRNASAAKQLQWDIKQKALKLTANSMYGCLGFEGSRFYARPLAALTTFKGREILQNTRELAESLQLDVIYGDTDSIFVNTGVAELQEATKIGNDFKKLVNDRYRLLEIDIDATFQRILLLQKKKYAALKTEEDGQTTMEIKGLDMKRREFCQLSKSVSAYVLKQILSGEAAENVVEHIHDYLESVGKRVRAGEVDLEQYIILKRLGKNPQDYPDAKSQPHVQVALRLQAKGQSVKAGDVIPYVFCLGDDGITARAAKADRAFHPDELRKSGSTLKIDYDFYLSLQVLPPVERLCDPIEGTERARLAEVLGLDPSRFRSQQAIVENEREFHTFESQISDAERFRLCEPLVVRCRMCGKSSPLGGLMSNDDGMIKPTGVHCSDSNCGATIPTASLQVQVENQVRAAISKFYESWVVCDDQSCGNRTRMIGVYGKRCLKPECRGRMHNEYSDARLYNQMLYFQSLFDTDKARMKVMGTARAEEINALSAQNSESFAQITAAIEKYMIKCGRRYVSLSGVFSYMALRA